MIKSMTGFAAQEARLTGGGKLSVEIRSINHKFLDVVLHLPEGLLSLEGLLKNEVSAKIKRGRVTGVVSLSAINTNDVLVNQHLLKKYLFALKNIQKKFGIGDEISLDTIMHLPGILSLVESNLEKEKLWPLLKQLVNQALDALLKMQAKEGRGLGLYLAKQTRAIKADLGIICLRFKKVVKERLIPLKTDEERSSLLKDTDISEEAQRLAFHLRNFNQGITKHGAMGKELDFIAQEMQREANTIGAKSCDSAISSRVVRIKSQIEKIREQVQNVV